MNLFAIILAAAKHQRSNRIKARPKQKQLVEQISDVLQNSRYIHPPSEDRMDWIGWKVMVVDFSR
jgi:hypothetical protein